MLIQLEQEIINLTIEIFKLGIRYYYEGMTLRTYCKENNINIGMIEHRISKIRENNPDLSDDEIVDVYIEDIRIKKLKENKMIKNKKTLFINVFFNYINKIKKTKQMLS